MDAESLKMIFLILKNLLHRPMRRTGWLVGLALLGTLSACKVGPDYVRPTMDVGVTFKESQGWQPARPAADAARGPWWEMYQDETLSELMQPLGTMRARQGTSMK